MPATWGKKQEVEWAEQLEEAGVVEWGADKVTIAVAGEQDGSHMVTEYAPSVGAA